MAVDSKRVNESDSLKREYTFVNKKFLRERGWTRTAIKRILGEPDHVVAGLRYRKDRPECMYSMERVITAEAAGLIRFRKPGERVVPGGGIPDDIAERMVAANSARERKRILRNWAISKGYVRPLDPPDYRRRQLAEVIENFCTPTD